MSIAPEITDPAKVIADTLHAHGVNVRTGPTFAGPAVTQYAVSLTSGTKLRAVVALEKDIALALGLEDVRIVAPIPGTSYVGVEVPSQSREDVEYADFVNDELTMYDMKTGKPSALPFPVGVTVQSEPVWADLAKLPHLLIAGTSGSGKSVALNSLITSLIDHRTPDEVRLWLIDPKRVELAAFADAPHVEDVATDTNAALDLLVDVEGIMDARYRAFEEVGVRNITEINEWQRTEGRTPLSYQVVVVDELADLMMAGVKGIEERIVRIAQLGRAAGIHLVLATQRPTKNVVTGLISANVTSRWSFAVGSVVDSMVALDQPGAQALYGRGDSLWLPAGARFPARVQAVHADAGTVNGIIADAIIARNGATTESTRSPDAADDTDELDQLPGLEDLQTIADDEVIATARKIMVKDRELLERLKDGDDGIDGLANDVIEEQAYEQAVETDEWSEPVLTARPVDRSQSWLDSTPKHLADSAPNWTSEPTSEDLLLERIAVLEAQMRSVTYTAPTLPKRPSFWRRHRSARVTAYVVGGVLALGWVGNIIEAIAR